MSNPSIQDFEDHDYQLHVDRMARVLMIIKTADQAGLGIDVLDEAMADLLGGGLDSKRVLDAFEDASREWL